MHITPEKRDFLSLDALTRFELESLLDLSARYKKDRRKHPRPLKDCILGTIFEKSSTRTRVSFEVAMIELGGAAMSLDSQVMQIGRGETYADTARVLSRYVDFLCLRTFEHARLEELARFSRVPVINALTDRSHPCQLLADLLTVQEEGFGDWSTIKVAYVGDGNNMAHSWIEAAECLQFELVIATPPDFGVDPVYLERAVRAPTISLTTSPEEAVDGAHVVTTDTWFSMGQVVSDEKRAAFLPFQVNGALMKKARDRAIFLHCLPAHRGEEVTDEVMDGRQSRVFDEAENRIHAQKAVLLSVHAKTS